MYCRFEMVRYWFFYLAFCNFLYYSYDKQPSYLVRFVPVSYTFQLIAMSFVTNYTTRYLRTNYGFRHVNPNVVYRWFSGYAPAITRCRIDWILNRDYLFFKKCS